jgi:hypothetical protein
MVLLLSTPCGNVSLTTPVIQQMSGTIGDILSKGRQQMTTRCRPIKGCVKIAMVLGALGMTLSGVAVAQTGNKSICKLPPSAYTILKNQRYALCAGASSFIFDKITYAKCTIQNGDSISKPFNYPFPSPNPPVGNITTVNQEGIANGSFYTSTYYPPADATTAGGDVAVYTCNTAGSNNQGSNNQNCDGDSCNKSGSYAQCDGGICFTSTENTSFPGLGAVGANEIVCSCPITTTNSDYQIFGPFGTQFFGPHHNCPTTASDYDAICGIGITANNNGHNLYIGSPTGVPVQLAECLTGQTPKFNTCTRPVK